MWMLGLFIKRSTCPYVGIPVWDLALGYQRYRGIRGIGVSGIGVSGIGVSGIGGYGIGELLLDYGTDVIPFDEERSRLSGLLISKTMMGILIFLTHGKGSHVHDIEVLAMTSEKLIESYLVASGIFVWICCVDAIYLGAFENNICIDFTGAKGSSRVGSKIRIAGTR